MDPVRTPVRQEAHSGGRQLPSRLVAFLLTSILALAGLSVLAPTAATAATPLPGMTTNITFGGTTYDGYPVLAENAEGTLTIQYSKNPALLGKTVEIELPEGVTLGAFTGGNQNVAVTQVGGKLRLVFANTFDSDQGVVTLKFKYTNLEKSEIVDFTYTVGGTAVSQDLIEV